MADPKNQIFKPSKAELHPSIEPNIDINPIFHRHTGTDSPKIRPKDFAPYDILTAVPTFTGKEGEVRVTKVSGVYQWYIYEGGAWNAMSSGGNFYTVRRTRASSAGTGDEAITGFGFAPSFVKIRAWSDGLDHGASWGSADTQIDQQCMYASFDTGSGSWEYKEDVARIIAFDDSTGNTVTATLKTFDSDGVTITWNTVQVNMKYIIDAWG